jgi:hypothetical protein
MPANVAKDAVGLIFFSTKLTGSGLFLMPE